MRAYKSCQSCAAFDAKGLTKCCVNLTVFVAQSMGSEAAGAATCCAGAGRRFVQTPSVERHLRNLARAVLLRRHPILLQGPTSSGKTSLVAYLAAQTGHHFVRINNHQQTDLQARRSFSVQSSRCSARCHRSDGATA